MPARRREAMRGKRYKVGFSVKALTTKLLLSSAALLIACGGDDDPAATPLEVDIAVSGVVGGEAFACGQSYGGIGTSNSTWEGRDFRFYLSNVRLVNSAGAEVPVELEQDGRWQEGSVVLLDFEDGSGACQMGNPDLNDRIRGTVPAGDYSGIRFDLGVPFDVNHDDPAAAPAPLNITAMHWNWQVGYKFIRVDGVTTGLPSWRFHLGSTGCDGDMMGNVTACANPNRSSVEISDFDPAADTLVADLAELFSTSDLETDAMDDPGCMSKPTDVECATYFAQLGLPFGSQAGASQSFFSRQ